MIFLVSLVTMASQLMLKKGIADLVQSGITFEAPMRFFLHAARSWTMVAAAFLQVVSYGLWIYAISRFKLGYVVAVSGALLYLLLAAAGWMLFDERLTALQWGGVVFITLGVVCMNIG